MCASSRRVSALRRCALLGAVGGLLVFEAPGVRAQEALRELPPTEHQPRTRAEFAALRFWQATLPAGWEHVFPEHVDEYRAFLQRAARLVERYGEAERYDLTLADEWIAELYVDNGHPRLNAVAQDFIIALMTELPSLPEERLPRAVRERLAMGLTEYALAGGGQFDPAAEAQLADTIQRLAPGYAPELVDSLLEDALDWARELGADYYRQPVYRACVRRWGEVFWLRVHDAELRPESLPKELPARYRKAVAALSELLSQKCDEEREFARRVHHASRLALEDFDDRRLEDDLTSRLLIVYRCLLARRPAVARAVSDYIDDRLVWLAAKSRRLRTDKHWELWAQAASALRPARISSRFKSYLRTAPKAQALSPAQQRALHQVADSALSFAERSGLAGRP